MTALDEHCPRAISQMRRRRAAYLHDRESSFPSSASASGTFGVTSAATAATFANRAHGPLRQQRLPVLAHHHRVHHQRKLERDAARATASTISAEPSAPVFAAAGRNVLQHRFNCSITSAAALFPRAKPAPNSAR